MGISSLFSVHSIPGIQAGVSRQKFDKGFARTFIPETSYYVATLMRNASEEDLHNNDPVTSRLRVTSMIVAAAIISVASAMQNLAAAPLNLSGRVVQLDPLQGLAEFRSGLNHAIQNIFFACIAVFLALLAIANPRLTIGPLFSGQSWETRALHTHPEYRKEAGNQLDGEWGKAIQSKEDFKTTLVNFARLKQEQDKFNLTPAQTTTLEKIFGQLETVTNNVGKRFALEILVEGNPKTVVLSMTKQEDLLFLQKHIIESMLEANQAAFNQIEIKPEIGTWDSAIRTKDAFKKTITDFASLKLRVNGTWEKTIQSKKAFEKFIVDDDRLKPKNGKDKFKPTAEQTAKLEKIFEQLETVTENIKKGFVPEMHIEGDLESIVLSMTKQEDLLLLQNHIIKSMLAADQAAFNQIEIKPGETKYSVTLIPDQESKLQQLCAQLEIVKNRPDPRFALHMLVNDNPQIVVLSMAKREDLFLFQEIVAQSMLAENQTAFNHLQVKTDFWEQETFLTEMNHQFNFFAPAINQSHDVKYFHALHTMLARVLMTQFKDRPVGIQDFRDRLQNDLPKLLAKLTTEITNQLKLYKKPDHPKVVFLENLKKALEAFADGIHHNARKGFQDGRLYLDKAAAAFAAYEKKEPVEAAKENVLCKYYEENKAFYEAHQKAKAELDRYNQNLATSAATENDATRNVEPLQAAKEVIKAIDFYDTHKNASDDQAAEKSQDKPLFEKGKSLAEKFTFDEKILRNEATEDQKLLFPSESPSSSDVDSPLGKFEKGKSLIPWNEASKTLDQLCGAFTYTAMHNYKQNQLEMVCDLPSDLTIENFWDEFTKVNNFLDPNTFQRPPAHGKSLLSLWLQEVSGTANYLFHPNAQVSVPYVHAIMMNRKGGGTTKVLSHSTPTVHDEPIDLFGKKTTISPAYEHWVKTCKANKQNILEVIYESSSGIEGRRQSERMKLADRYPSNFYALTLDVDGPLFKKGYEEAKTWVAFAKKMSDSFLKDENGIVVSENVRAMLKMPSKNDKDTPVLDTILNETRDLFFKDKPHIESQEQYQALLGLFYIHLTESLEGASIGDSGNEPHFDFLHMGCKDDQDRGGTIKAIYAFYHLFIHGLPHDEEEASNALQEIIVEYLGQTWMIKKKGVVSYRAKLLRETLDLLNVAKRDDGTTGFKKNAQTVPEDAKMHPATGMHYPREIFNEVSASIGVPPGVSSGLSYEGRLTKALDPSSWITTAEITLQDHNLSMKTPTEKLNDLKSQIVKDFHRVGKQQFFHNGKEIPSDELTKLRMECSDGPKKKDASNDSSDELFNNSFVDKFLKLIFPDREEGKCTQDEIQVLLMCNQAYQSYYVNLIALQYQNSDTISVSNALNQAKQIHIDTKASPIRVDVLGFVPQLVGIERTHYFHTHVTVQGEKATFVIVPEVFGYTIKPAAKSTNSSDESPPSTPTDSDHGLLGSSDVESEKSEGSGSSTDPLAQPLIGAGAGSSDENDKI